MVQHILNNVFYEIYKTPSGELTFARVINRNVVIEVKSKNKINSPYITYMNNSKEIKSEINNTIRLLKENKINGENLIILAGNRLQLGISLKDVDIVCYMLIYFDIF